MPDTPDDLVDYLQQRGILETDRIIDAFHAVPREQFVPEKYASHAYSDTPLPIGSDQTISAPHMVAHMTELLDPRSGHRVLEIGAGSGYQAAILSHLVDEVITVEIVEELAQQARENLSEYENVQVIHGDGSQGYHDAAPYDRILYTAASPRRPPEDVFDQLADNGMLIAPIGDRSIRDGCCSNSVYSERCDTHQTLNVYRKQDGEVTEEQHYGVRFVPLTGEEGREE